MNAPVLPVPPGLFDEAPGSLVHAAREAIVTIDESQRIVMFNPAAQRMFGCTAEEALGSELTRFIPQRYRAAHPGHVRRFDASGLTEWSMGERLPVTGLRASGEEFPVAITITRVDTAGALGGGRFFTALLCDLSQEHDLRLELATLRQRFQAIFELSPNAVWIAEGERIAFVNRACMALFAATSREDLVGRSIYSLLHPESHAIVRQEVGRALESGAALPLLHERIERLDGKVRDVEIALAPLPDHGQTTLQMVITDITQRKHEALELARSRHALRGLSERLVEAREDERRRIARELHDDLGQRLTALKMELASLRQGLAGRAAEGRIGAMLELLDETVASVRRIAADLRPLMLDDLGLNAAIEWLARDASRRMGVEVTVRLGDGDPPLDDRASIALYRMVQEALTNVARHAHATEAQIEMRHVGDTLLLSVCDNGIGFPARAMQKEGSFGLMGIRERAFMLGGEMDVDNPPGGGGRLIVRLPLARAAESSGERQRQAAP
jgi:two-component system, NarL family, sensor histidine kinase UhpB